MGPTQKQVRCEPACQGAIKHAYLVHLEKAMEPGATAGTMLALASTPHTMLLVLVQTCTQPFVSCTPHDREEWVSALLLQRLWRETPLTLTAPS